MHPMRHSVRYGFSTSTNLPLARQASVVAFAIKTGIRSSTAPVSTGLSLVTASIKLAVNESEADVVRIIYDKYVQGYGAQRIATDLNKLGY